MRYDAVLFDVDETLLNFHQGEKNALEKTLTHYAMNTPQAAQTYRACNAACWKALERGEIDQKTLRYKRFRDFLFIMNRADDPVEMGDMYMNALSRESILLPGALEVVKEVAGLVKVAAVTNGISFIQHGRLDHSPLRPYFSALVISDELGVSKPNPRIAHEALRQLGVPPERALMVGDSISSDILCARNAGMDACWYNPKGLEPPQDVPIAYEIKDLSLLPAIIRGEEKN